MDRNTQKYKGKGQMVYSIVQHIPSTLKALSSTPSTKQ